MRSRTIEIWKFETAPMEIRALHTSPLQPEWVALIPSEIHLPDIGQEILARQIPNDIYRYKTPDGDIVYMGCCPVAELLDTVPMRSEERRSSRG